MNHSDSSTLSGRRLRGTVVLALAALATSTLAGCSSGDAPDATAGSSSTAPADAWGSCMRAAGFQVEDPTADEWEQHRTKLPAGADRDAFTAAAERCRGDEDRVSDTDQQRFAQQLRDFSACMREHGIEDFPEPDERGALDFGKYGTRAGDTPAFRAADETCHEQYLADWGSR